MSNRVRLLLVALCLGATSMGATLRATTYYSPFTAGQTLSGSDCLYSSNGDYRLCMHPSGSYLDAYNIPYFTPYWLSSGDFGPPGSLGSHVSQTSFPNDGNAHLQLDGNFIIFSAEHDALWTTQTDGNSDAYVVVENDGNVVIYNSSDVPIWSIF